MNTVLHGDCLELMKDLPDKSIDMILCDLPYGTTACSWDVLIPFDLLWAQYSRIIKDSGVIVLTGSEPFSSMLRMSNLKWYRYDWVWNKVGGANFMNLKNRPWKTHENVMVFAKNADFTFNPIRASRSEKSLIRYKKGFEYDVTTGSRAEHYGIIQNRQSKVDTDGKKHPIDIIEFTKGEIGKYNDPHPTKKPVGLFNYLIRTYTNEGDLVLDNCAGSGTTAIACLKSNRNYILMEKEDKYYELILNRIKKETQQIKLL